MNEVVALDAVRFFMIKNLWGVLEHSNRPIIA